MSALSAQPPGELTDAQTQALLTPPPAWKQRALWTSILIALISTGVVLAIVWVVLSNSSGWDYSSGRF